MKLYIKQKVFSWRERFSVKDEGQQDRWFAQGEIFTFAKKLHVYDIYGAEVALIRQKLFTFLHRYYIVIGGYEYEFVKELSLFRPRYTIRNLDWIVDGNFFEHDYSVNDSKGVVMTISKAWFSFGDFYELNISDSQNELLCLCVALAIDCISADRASSSNTTRIR
jgi:uncharacterized protein YxjI